MSRKIAIVAPSSVPFQIGGAEKFWLGLRQALSWQPNTFVDLVKLPSPEATFAQILSSYQAFYNLDLSHFDMVISTKYPAWMVRHPRHIVYMQHTLRGLYDTWHFNGISEKLPLLPVTLRPLQKLLEVDEPRLEHLPELFALCHDGLKQKVLDHLFSMPGPLARKVVRFMDRAALSTGNIRAWLAISRTVRKRKDYFPPETHVKILHHPSDLASFPCDKGEYIFTCSRLNGSKRIDLIIKAMRYVKEPLRLKISGTGQDMEMLKQLASGDPRIEFLGFVPDSELPNLYAKALFVPYVPYNEDYGLITIEAMNCGKPVVTTRDAGGVCEFVEDGVSGLVTEPTPEALGGAMQKLAADPGLCQAMGRNAREKTKHIVWDRVAAELLDYADTAVLDQLENIKPSILVCSVTAANKNGSGGERRLYHLCTNLARIHNVTLLTAGDRNQHVLDCRKLCDGVMHIAIPWPDNLGGEAEFWRNSRRYSVDDVQMMEWCAKDAFLRKVFLKAAAHARCVVLFHPGLYPLVRENRPDLPLIYDSDVNADLKKEILAGASNLIDFVKSVENDVCCHASMVWACSREDMDRFARLYGVEESRLLFVPNGFDSSEVEFMDSRQRRAIRRQLPFGREKMAIFIGSGHGPNVEAAKAIISMAPRLPDIQFMIVGTVGVQPAIQKQKIPDNVHIIGKVSDKTKMILLARADVGLNPICHGAGSNLKIIEYLACGLPCVSTPFGMRGQPRDWQAGARIGSLEEFPALIKDLLEHPVPERTIRKLAEHAATHQEWSACFAPACARLAEMLENGVTLRQGERHGKISL